MKFYQILLLSILFSGNIQAQFDSKFYFPEKKWEKIEGVKYKEIFFKTDTANLSGVVLYPPGKQLRATIIYFHGAGGNVTTYISIVKPLVDAGFVVFMIDMQGYGKSTGKPSHMNIAKDAQVVFEKIIKRTDVKGSKIVIMGISMGTQIATKIAKDNQNKINALVLEGTVSSFTDIAAESSPKEQQNMIRTYLKSPYSAKEDIKKITYTPKLLIHSIEDSTVSIEEGRTVYNNALDPKEFWEVKGKHLEAINLYEEEYIKRLKILIGKQ